MEGGGAATERVIEELTNLRKRLKWAEEEISQAMSLLNSTMESTADGILVVDRAGRIVLYSQKFAQLWRIPESVIASRDDDRVLAFVLDQLKEPQGFLDKVKDLYNQPSAESFDVLEFKDGRVFERYSQPQRVGNQIIGRVWSFRDVTEHKRVDEALRLSEEAARRLAKENEVIAEIGKIISASLNIEETYERFAEEARKLIPFDRIMVALNHPKEGIAKVAYVSGIGLEERRIGDVYPLKQSGNEEVMRSRAGLLVQPESEEELAARFSTLIHTFRLGLRSMLTVPLISGNQVIGALHFRSKKIKAYTGRDLELAERIGDQIAGAIANARLFSERKLAEEALQDREERFKQVTENAGEWIWEVDAQGLYTYASPVVEEILGYKPEEIVGKKHFYDFFNPPIKEELKRLALEAFGRKQGIRKLENENLHKDGHLVYLETSAAPILDAKGNLRGYRGADTDISERKRAEEEREKLIRNLQKALSEVKALSGLLPICSSCKKIRDDKGYWNKIESYIQTHSQAEFSHSICPECAQKLYPEFLKK